MCYSKADGGLRCNTHAKSRLEKALDSGDLDRISEAQYDYDLTAQGIAELVESGQLDIAMVRQTERDAKLAVARLNRQSGRDKQTGKDKLIGVERPKVKDKIVGRRTLPRNDRKCFEHARNPNCPDWAMREWLLDPRPLVRGGLAINPNCPSEYLDMLGEDRVSGVRQRVARHANIGVSIRKQLLSDEDLEVRRVMASRLDLTEDEFAVLAGDPAPEIQRAIARQADVPPEVLETLASSESVDVRMIVAGNPNTPVSALETLASDKHEDVALAVLQNTNVTQKAIWNVVLEHEGWREGIAMRGDLHPWTLEQLANDDDHRVRKAVVNNATASATALVNVWNHGISTTGRQTLDFSNAMAIVSHPNLEREQAEAVAAIQGFPEQVIEVARKRLESGSF